MFNKKDRKKNSASALETVTSSQMMMPTQMMLPHQGAQMPHMWPMFPWNMCPPAAGTPPQAKDINKKPWDTSSDSSDDFAPKKKRKSKATTAADGEKRGPGRPKKTETLLKEADSKILQNYPLVSGKDAIAFVAADECRNCRLWKGRVALEPCGHSSYCYSCITKLKEEAIKLKRPGKCFADGCYELVTSWFTLYNISP